MITKISFNRNEDFKPSHKDDCHALMAQLVWHVAQGLTSDWEGTIVEDYMMELDQKGFTTILE